MRSRSDTAWHGSPLALLLALAAAAGLLGVFMLVVLQGMRQSAERRVEDSALVDARWRCGLSKGAQARIECMGAYRSTRLASQGPAP